MRNKRSFSRYAATEDEGLINLTPLIDVVFVVLIMFIIIAPMLEVDKVQLARASVKESKEMTVLQENSPITLRVRADNTIWLNNNKVAEENLVTLLKLAKKQNPEKIPQLFHDKKAFFGTYQIVKNSLESAGFYELDVLLEPG
ncbi:MAG: biopolymer transporter ExbD [Chlamydiota bacterium]